MIELSNKIISPVKDLGGLIADKSLELYVAIPNMAAQTENYTQGGIRDKLEDLLNNPSFRDVGNLTSLTAFTIAGLAGGTIQLRKGNKVRAALSYVPSAIFGVMELLYIVGRYL